MTHMEDINGNFVARSKVCAIVKAGGRLVRERTIRKDTKRQRYCAGGDAKKGKFGEGLGCQRSGTEPSRNEYMARAQEFTTLSGINCLQIQSNLLYLR